MKRMGIFRTMAFAMVVFGVLGGLPARLHASVSARPSANEDTLFGGTRTLISFDGHTGFLIQPKSPAAGRPWIWYAPTFIGANPNASCAWYMERLLQHGFCVAGVDVGESYGSPAGRKIYSAFYDTLMARHHLNPKACLMPQSRGGLMLYNWAADGGNAAKVARIAGIYPVGDLRSYPKLAVAAPAYGMTEAQLQADLAANNPIDRLAPFRKQGIEILHLHGDADVVVPLTENSQVIHDRYVALGGKMSLIVVPGKGHAEVPEFFQNQAYLDFLLAELQVTAVLSPASRSGSAPWAVSAARSHADARIGPAATLSAFGFPLPQGCDALGRIPTP